MNYRKITAIAGFLILVSCNANKKDYDASGNFEADEVIVSAQQTGELLSFTAAEGDSIAAGTVVGQIDVSIPKLQKEQTEASIAALRQKTSSPAPRNEVIRKQLAVLQTRLDNLFREQKRTQNLINADAAPAKQLDDINTQIEELQKQIAVSQQEINLYSSNTATQNRSILSEKAPLEKSAQQFQEQIDKGQIINPVTGVVLTRYALKGEMAMLGKPLYKIANTDTLSLRAYISGTQLPEVKLGQQVTVRIDHGAEKYKNYPGIITWISDKSEFTPKTILTKDERNNLVYAIKVRVKNDGYLKIGMYGELLLR
jgi:HlyD family secretion protein